MFLCGGAIEKEAVSLTRARARLPATTPTRPPPNCRVPSLTPHPSQPPKQRRRLAHSANNAKPAAARALVVAAAGPYPRAPRSTASSSSPSPHPRSSSSGNLRGSRSTMSTAATPGPGGRPIDMAPFVPAVAFEPPSLAKLSASSAPAADFDGDLLVVAVTEDDLDVQRDPASKAALSAALKSSSAALADLDKALAGAVAEILASGGFDGKPGAPSKCLRLFGAAKGPKHVALIGLGKAEKLNDSTANGAAAAGGSAFATAGGAVASLCKAQRLRTAALAFPTAPSGSVTPAAVQRAAMSALVGAYESTRFKSASPPAPRLEALTLLSPAADDAALEAAAANAAGNLLARYLVEAPPNVCTPTHIADAAKHIATLCPGKFTLKVLEADDCAKMGMGCFLGVSEASLEPPKFIHLTYKSGPSAAQKPVAIVGKGLTFDSGGYNLKAGPGSMIELMKFDMGGAAATLGAARVLAGTQPEGVECHFIIASCENMVGGKGLRPGDILTSAKGKTVEINNTDAEGRLTLCDAMWYAQHKAGAKAVVDIATLTGACMVALGTEVAAVYSPSDSFAGSVMGAAKQAGERVWRMPLEASYFEGLKSPVADMRNTAGRFGGSITAALFLQQFVEEGVDWAHLDIAGPVWSEKEGLPTGFGANLLAQWAASTGKA
jgi:leucyl aminopeptidase